MIVQPTKDNMGFDCTSLNIIAILNRLSYAFLGGLTVSGLFLFVQEIPSLEFVFLIAIFMLLIDVYLLLSSTHVTDSGDNVTDSDDSITDSDDSITDSDDSITDPNGGDDK